jgi:hypothetical protein
VRILGCVGLGVAFALLSGCTASRIDGRARAEPSSKIETLAVVYDDMRTPVPREKPKPGEDVYTAQRKAFDSQRQMAILIRERFPAIFAANGVELQVYNTSSGAERYQQDTPDRRHVLQLTPTGQTYSGAVRMWTFSMYAQLTELQPVSRTLWTASMSLSRHDFASLDAKLADEFAVKIVDDLKAAGLIGPGARTVAVRPADPLIAAQAVTPAPAVRSVQDVEAVPLLDERGRKGYREWLTKKLPRAFVIAEDGSWNSTWSTSPKDAADPKDPAQRALSHCARRGRQSCRLYAVDDRVVWGPE